MIKHWQYLLSGTVLMVFLVGAIVVVHGIRPRLPYTQSDFPRAQGPVDAPVQIIEYSDYQCPACQVAQSAMTVLLGEYGGKIRLIFQHFPLEGHPWSRWAHQAAECAAQQHRFWSYSNRLYAHQSDWSQSTQAPLETFIRYAKEEGLDLDAFGRCLSDPKISRKIEEERVAGQSLGVRSTPSFFVNGVMVVGTENLREGIEKAANE